MSDAKRGLVEHICGQLAGTLIVMVGKRALKRGDVHEYRHMAAALAAGNTGPTSHSSGLCMAIRVLDEPPP